MMRIGIALTVVVVAGAHFARPAEARQIGGIGKGLQIAKKANDVRELQMTDAEEQALGKQVSDKIRTRYGVVQDAEVHKYVGLVGLALAQNSSRPALPWTFIVLDTDGVNAFAAPGGYVFITTAAVKTAKSEDELANLLAHEVAHVIRGHALGNIQKSRYADVSADLLQAAGTATLSPEQVNQLNSLLEGIINDTLEAMFVKGYSRDTEFEADRLGAEYAGKAGYDPTAMRRFLDTLAKQQATSEGGFYATHPSTKERQDKLAAVASANPAVAVPKVRTSRFQTAVAKLK